MTVTIKKKDSYQFFLKKLNKIFIKMKEFQSNNENN